MSDVMVLLLTFFMLTATFVKEEPIQVQTPGSVSEIKIPEKNLLTIFVNPQGQVYMNLDSEPNMRALLDQMESTNALSGLSPEQKSAFANCPTQPRKQRQAQRPAPSAECRYSLRLDK